MITRTTVQLLTSLDKEKEKVNTSVSEFDTEISRHFKEEEDLTYDGSNPNPEDWSEYLEYDPDFQKKFDGIINYSNGPEDDSYFTSDFF